MTGVTMLNRLPHSALRGTVLRYAGYAETTGAPARFREFPCTFVPIIVDLATGWTVTHAGPSGEVTTHLRSFVAGVTDATVHVGHDGTAECLQIDLTVLGARRLLGMPMSELANRTLPLDDVLDEFGRDLVQRVGDVSDWDRRFQIVDAALLARLADAPAVDDGVAWSLGRIASTGGTAAIGELAADLGWSHRRLIARYREFVGLPPKAISRITRFEHLNRRVAGMADVNWAAVASECGYFDQAHMIRDVRELAGVTPTQLWSDG